MSSSQPDELKQRRPVTVDDQRMAERCARGRIVLIDDDWEILAALAALLDLEGYAFEMYSSALGYLQDLALHHQSFPGPSCVLCDVKMPELGGLELQCRLAEFDDVPLLLMSGASGAQEAVSAFRAGALDFLIKPIEAVVLIAAVTKALAVSVEQRRLRERQVDLVLRIASLTRRESEVARLVAQGQINRDIGRQLGMALRTVKLHRQRAMEKLDVSRVVDLARLVDESGL